MALVQVLLLVWQVQRELGWLGKAVVLLQVGPLELEMVLLW